jgi:hypothetical protein
MDLRKLSAIAVSSALLSTPSQAAIIGYFDVIYVGMVDSAAGWMCDTNAPFQVPPGNLVIYIDGPVGTGELYYEAPVSSVCYVERPDVANAGMCGGFRYTGWQTGAVWLAAHPTVHAYYRDPGGSLQELNASGKNCTGITYGPCY